jgi:RNA polymerase sigma factor (sigma-70 family)
VDHGDFAAAVDRHYPGLVQRLTLVLHDAEEAKDVAQDAYAKAFTAWDSFDGTDARAWIHTIGLRLAFNHLRRRRLWDRWLHGRHSESWLMPERVDLWNALGDLKPQQRAALLLNVVDGYTQAEVGQMLDTPAGTVASWIHQGPHACHAGGGPIVNDDWLRSELEALESAAPTDVPPYRRRASATLRIGLAASLAAAAVVLAVVTLPSVTKPAAVEPSVSPSPTATSAPTTEPSASVQPTPTAVPATPSPHPSGAAELEWTESSFEGQDVADIEWVEDHWIAGGRRVAGQRPGPLRMAARGMPRRASILPP